jgi:nucleoside-diphosphate-sugar epimerase
MRCCAGSTEPRAACGFAMEVLSHDTKKIVVLGASGFVGTMLVEHLLPRTAVEVASHPQRREPGGCAADRQARAARCHDRHAVRQS